MTCIAWNSHWEDPFMFGTGSHDGGVQIWSSPSRARITQWPIKRRHSEGDLSKHKVEKKLSPDRASLPVVRLSSWSFGIHIIHSNYLRLLSLPSLFLPNHCKRVDDRGHHHLPLFRLVPMRAPAPKFLPKADGPLYIQRTF